jgi:hypothetical protein
VCWYNTIKSENDVLHENDTWSLVPFDPIMNVVGYQWVYKIKRRIDGVLTATKFTWLYEGSLSRQRLIT